MEPYVFPLLRKHFTYKTYQCKFYLIVPEEGWFGQPKYSTPSKNFTYVVSVFASIFLIYTVLNLKMSLQKPTYITTRYYKNIKNNQRDTFVDDPS